MNVFLFALFGTFSLGHSHEYVCSNNESECTCSYCCFDITPNVCMSCNIIRCNGTDYTDERNGTDYTDERNGTDYSDERNGTDYSDERNGTDYSDERNFKDSFNNCNHTHFIILSILSILVGCLCICLYFIKCVEKIRRYCISIYRKSETQHHRIADGDDNETCNSNG